MPGTGPLQGQRHEGLGRTGKKAEYVELRDGSANTQGWRSSLPTMFPVLNLWEVMFSQAGGGCQGQGFLWPTTESVLMPWNGWSHFRTSYIPTLSAEALSSPPHSLRPGHRDQAGAIQQEASPTRLLSSWQRVKSW